MSPSAILARGAVRLRRHPERLDAALSGLFLLLWTSGFSVVKIGLETVPPLTFLALRYACVVALLAPIQLGFRLPLPRARGNWLDLGLIGFSIQFVYFSGIYIAMRLGLSAGAVALIVSLQPILVGVLSPLWVGEPVSRRQWLGLALGFIGAGSVILAKSRVEATSWAGIGFALAALLGITLGLLYEKKTNASVHPIVSTLTQTGGALALLLPCILLFESRALETGAIQWGGGLAFSLAYLVLCNSLIAIVLLFYLARRRSAMKLSSLFFLVPPGAALMAILLTGETMPWLAWMGIGLTASGVWLAHR